MSFFGLAAAQDNTTTTATKPGILGNGNVDFVPTPSNDTGTIDDVAWVQSWFNFTAFQQAGATIRRGTQEQCFGNLSLALGSIGPIVSASSSGASGALTLLPTAGALIGAPAKELWILYKLVPLAGVFSMMLSLGGNIVPNTAGEYELEGYNFGGVIATAGGRYGGDGDANLLSVKNVDPVTFAQVVKTRAENPLGSNKRTTVAIGVLCQAILITVIFVCCWMTGSGSIISWACRVRILPLTCCGHGLTTRAAGLGLDDGLVLCPRGVVPPGELRLGSLQPAMDDADIDGACGSRNQRRCAHGLSESP